MMLQGLFRRAKSVVREFTKNHTRSPYWARVRKYYLKKYPECAACGEKKLLQVHHKLPFHLEPKLELDEANLITLCMGRFECHLNVGHGGFWSAYNPNVEASAKKFHELLSDPDGRASVIAEAKRNRLRDEDPTQNDQ